MGKYRISEKLALIQENGLFEEFDAKRDVLIAGGFKDDEATDQAARDMMKKHALKLPPLEKSSDGSAPQYDPSVMRDEWCAALCWAASQSDLRHPDPPPNGLCKRALEFAKDNLKDFVKTFASAMEGWQPAGGDESELAKDARKSVSEARTILSQFDHTQGSEGES